MKRKVRDGREEKIERGKREMGEQIRGREKGHFCTLSGCHSEKG